jgi:hypothetical protein
MYLYRAFKSWTEYGLLTSRLQRKFTTSRGLKAAGCGSWEALLQDRLIHKFEIDFYDFKYCGVSVMADYIFEKNVEIPLQGKQAGGKVRANVYRPHGEGRHPVLVTYGPCKYLQK